MGIKLPLKSSDKEKLFTVYHYKDNSGLSYPILNVLDEHKPLSSTMLILLIFFILSNM